MAPEDRIALIAKITTKINDMADDDLKDLAKEVGVEEVVEDADKTASKMLADAVMSKPAVVDTSILSGPRSGLKNFLLKSERENDAK